MLTEGSLLVAAEFRLENELFIYFSSLLLNTDTLRLSNKPRWAYDQSSSSDHSQERVQCVSHTDTVLPWPASPSALGVSFLLRHQDPIAASDFSWSRELITAGHGVSLGAFPPAECRAFLAVHSR